MFSASDKIEFKADKFKVSAQSLIQLESMKDFKEKGMDIVTEATKSYAMKSMTTAKLEATTEMTISGTMKTAVKGGVQLELGAGAMASLKAGIVQIN